MYYYPYLYRVSLELFMGILTNKREEPSEIQHLLNKLNKLRERYPDLNDPAKKRASIIDNQRREPSIQDLLNTLRERYPDSEILGPGKKRAELSNVAPAPTRVILVKGHGKPTPDWLPYQPEPNILDADDGECNCLAEKGGAILKSLEPTPRKDADTYQAEVDQSSTMGKKAVDDTGDDEWELVPGSVAALNDEQLQAEVNNTESEEDFEVLDASDLA
ncbi:hypothetical protein B0H66DRAFT_533463 [Apodospora peruviana]|uniref:Uncharacterized protein n=1 Tax=Apodospora peruviana TaxID=516989 RepID=A0AAE0M4E5_9PEZI|nr:hypothetical protein B0H66DRAFT_533463 [Apodospora peruviana]